MSTSTVTWAAPTLANLQTYIEQGLLAVANTKDLASGQSDRFTQAMTDVTQKVRQKIQSVPGFVVSSTTNSIPPELLADVCWLIIGAIQSAYPALGLSKAQLEAIDAARMTIDAIKPGGDYRPSMPPDPQTTNVQGFPVAKVIMSSPRHVTAWSMRGI